MNAENVLLGQILIDNDVYYKLQPKAWWFTETKNRRVFETIENVLEQSETANVASVGVKYEPSYVSSLTDGVHTSKNAKYYADTCKELGVKEELRKLSHVIQNDIKTSDSDAILSVIDDTIEKISDGGGDYSIKAIQDLMVPMINDIEERYKNFGVLPGIPSGFSVLDNALLGFINSRLYVVGARPSQGKSALLLNFAKNISSEKRVGFISLENSWKEILMREIASMAKINSQHLMKGRMSQSSFHSLNNAADKLYNTQMYIYDKPNCSLQEVVTTARRMVQRNKCDILFVDYLQLIRVPQAKDRRSEVETASRRLKDLSRELDVPIVAAAQLRRDSDGRRPGLGDFQHSSAIEQDADTGLLLWHRVVGLDGKSLHKSKVENDDEFLNIILLIEKNRDGMTGDVPVEFDAEYVTFREKA